MPSDIGQVLALMRANIEAIAPMTDAEFGQLVARFRPRVLRKRAYLYRQGAVCGVVGFIGKGLMRNYHVEEDGEEYIVNFPREDWWVADLQSFHLGIPSMFNMQAIEECTMIVTGKAEFESALTDLEPFKRFYHAKIGRAYTANTLRIATDRSSTAEERYANIVRTQPWMLDRLPQRYLASYLGIRPQSLSRIRATYVAETTKTENRSPM